MGASEKLEQAKKKNKWGLGMEGPGLGLVFFSSLAPTI